MARNTGTIAVAILAIAALGFGILSFANQMYPIIPSPTSQRAVGIWEETTRNTDYAPYDLLYNFLIAVGDNRVLNTQYLAVSDAGTTITLIKAGWYKVRISTFLTGLAENSVYWVNLVVDGSTFVFFDRHETPTPLDTTYHSINAELAVSSNGATTIRIRVNAFNDPSLNVDGPVEFEQLVVEYLAV